MVADPSKKEVKQGTDDALAETNNSGVAYSTSIKTADSRTQ